MKKKSIVIAIPIVIIIIIITQHILKNKIELKVTINNECNEEYLEKYSNAGKKLYYYCVDDAYIQMNNKKTELISYFEENENNLVELWDKLYKKYEDTNHNIGWLDGGSITIITDDFYFAQCAAKYGNIYIISSGQKDLYQDIKLLCSGIEKV